VKDYITLIFWVVLAGAIFSLFWYKGYLARLSNYVAETREELRKCTWPNRQELKGSTVVVLLTTVLLAAFTMIVDFLVTEALRLIT
jgi:preprotein translocase subunit SecE